MYRMSKMKKSEVEESIKKTIPLSEPEIRGNEWKYIKECLDTNWVSSVGKYVDQFEHLMADYLVRKYAVACVSGTASLHIALLVTGVKPDDEVILPALTFIAPANAVRYVGAWPVFMDVQPDVWQMDPQKVLDFLNKECQQQNGRLINRNTGRRVSAIMPVHILGHPVDMDPILELARRFKLFVIEDAAESLGATYRGKPAGALGDIACLSFNGNKIITASGGGMLITDNQAWADKARYFTTQAKDDPLEYIHHEIGYNYRLSNIQAAIGVAQMQNLGRCILAKRRIAARYKEGLGDLAGITLPIEAEWAKSSFWLYTVLVDAGGYGMGSRDLLYRLKDANVQSRPLWHPIHTLRPFAMCYAYKITVANQLYRDGLSIPCSVGLQQEAQDRVIQVIKESGGKQGGYFGRVKKG